MTREDWLQKWTGAGLTREKLILRWETIESIVGYMMKSRKGIPMAEFNLPVEVAEGKANAMD